MSPTGPGRALAAAVAGAWLCACAGSAAGPPPVNAPGGEHSARLEAIRDGIAKDVDGLVQLMAPVPARVAVLGDLPADVSPADLEPDLVRTGLAACFAAPGQGPCTAPAVVALLDWAAGTGAPLHAMVQAKLAELSFLRSALAILMARSTELLQRMAEARVEAERIVGSAYGTFERTEENPLESSRVKDAAAAEFSRLMTLRDDLDKLSKRVEGEVRPLSDQALALHQQVSKTLATFGDVGTGPDGPAAAPPPAAGAAPAGTAAP